MHYCLQIKNCFPWKCFFFLSVDTAFSHVWLWLQVWVWHIQCSEEKSPLFIFLHDHLPFILGESVFLGEIVENFSRKFNIFSRKYLYFSRSFISDWTTTGPQDQHRCCLTGPFSTCAGFIYHQFSLNIKISWFGGLAKKEINWSCSKITGRGPTD